MRMTTGLELDETNSGFDRSSQMVLQDDMAGYAVNAKMIAPLGHALALLEPDHADPGAHHPRCRRRTGADAGVRVARIVQSARDAQRHAGVRRSGTLQGSTNMLASARDWARFGLLYLNDGVVGGQTHAARGLGGFSAAATLDTDYAAGFWTNRSEHERQGTRAARHPPRRVLCIRRSRPAHRDHAVAATRGRSSRRQRRSDRRYQRARPAGEGSDRGGGEVVIPGDAQGSDPESRDSGSGADAPSRNDGAR